MARYRVSGAPQTGTAYEGSYRLRGIPYRSRIPKLRRRSSSGRAALFPHGQNSRPSADKIHWGKGAALPRSRSFPFFIAGVGKAEAQQVWSAAVEL
jgi:hypothetical protein